MGGSSVGSVGASVGSMRASLAGKTQHINCNVLWAMVWYGGNGLVLVSLEDQ